MFARLLCKLLGHKRRTRIVGAVADGDVLRCPRCGDSAAVPAKKPKQAKLGLAA